MASTGVLNPQKHLYRELPGVTLSSGPDDFPGVVGSRLPDQGSYVQHRLSPEDAQWIQKREQVVDCAVSLSGAIEQAGLVLTPALLDGSLREFIATVAARHRIRFVSNGE